ncbi:MAG: hypothetical protein Q8N84_01870 [bacterium]|nr:hypothetical protein [bacterium]
MKRKTKRKAKRGSNVTCAFVHDEGLVFWSREAGSRQKAAAGAWPYGSIKVKGSGSIACFRPYFGADVVQKEFEGDSMGKGFPKACLWLRGRVQEAPGRRRASRSLVKRDEKGEKKDETEADNKQSNAGSLFL